MVENTIEENPGKSFWRDAIGNGLITGSMLLLCVLINEFTEHELVNVIGVVQFVALAGSIYIFTRQRSLKYGDGGFSFSQSMAYIVVMMVFTGLLTGIGDYVSYVFISPDYYGPLIEEAMDSNRAYQMYDGEMLEWLRVVIRAMYRNPVFFMFAGVIGKIIYGGLIGLFASSLIKREPVVTGTNE